jgi:hypothetical protein
VLPRSVASFCDRLTPHFSAALSVDASSTMNHTVRPRLAPRYNGSVTEPSVFSRALEMKSRVLPEPDEDATASTSGALVLARGDESAQPASTAVRHAAESRLDRFLRRFGIHMGTGPS